MGQAPQCHRQDRMASGRAVPKGRLHRHQPARGAGPGGALLQPARHRRTTPSRDIAAQYPARQCIKEGKYAFRWTRLSCKRFRDNEVRLQLHALAYNLATFLRCIDLPEAMADWSLTSLQLKLIKIGARVVRHARAITFQLAEVAVTGPMVRAILTAIHRLRAPPSCA